MVRVRTEDKTQQILAAALKRFLHYGLKKTSMQEVAHDAGVAVGTLYLYFKNKDELVIGCAEQFAVDHREQAKLLLSSRKRADRKLGDYVRHRYRIWQEVGLRAPHAEELANAVLHLRPEKTLEFAREFSGNIERLLREGKASGIFKHVSPARDAEVFSLSLAVFFPVAGREHPILPGEREFESLLAWFLETWSGQRKGAGTQDSRKSK